MSRDVVYQKLPDIVLFIGLIILILFTRTTLHIAPNVEFVTGASIFAAWAMRDKKLALYLPVFGMFLSDLVIGNSYIFLFTWSGFLFPAILGILNKPKAGNKHAKEYLQFFGSGIMGVMLFYFWTNFGVVLLGNMYPNTVSGLMQSYLNALPFLRNQLIGNIIILNLFYGAYIIYKNFGSKWTISSKVNSQSI